MYNAPDPSQPTPNPPSHSPPSHNTPSHNTPSHDSSPYATEHAHPYVANPAPSYPPAAAVAPPAPRDDLHARARIAGIALLAATGLLLLAALTKAWFTAGNDGGVGLLGLEKCRGLVCQSATWFDVKRIPTQIPIFATTALLATLAAIALMLHAGVMLLQNRAADVKLKWLSQVLGLTSFGMIAFVFSLSIGDWSRGLSVGWSTFVGIGGLVAAAAVTATMVRPLVQRS